MGILKCAALACWDTLRSNWSLYATMQLLSPVREQLRSSVSEWATGSARTPQGNDRLLSYRAMTEISEDGAVLDGRDSQAWAKYAIPKGLPQEGERRLAIENEPHYLDEKKERFIESGYGAGTKTLESAENAVLKVDGQTTVSRITVHRHEANVAGLHWDLVVENLEPGTDSFELNIPRGDYKGRYAFHRTEHGTVVTQMNDYSVRHEKPQTRLKDPSFLLHVEEHPDEWMMERKYDGSMSNCRVHHDRVYMRSHRDTPNAEPYTDKLPDLEFLYNRSRLWSCRKLFPGPDMDDTELQAELVHNDGSARTSGILNAYPDKARATQEKRGSVKAYVWDIKRYKGQDVSRLPYEERRKLYEEVVADMRCFNKNWHVAESFHPEMANDSYHGEVITDKRGLPYSEGVVVKHRTEDTWFKIKAHDTYDFTVVEILPGEPGSKYQTVWEEWSWKIQRPALAARLAVSDSPTSKGNGFMTIATRL